MELKTHTRDGVPIVDILGEVDVSTYVELHKVIVDQVAAGQSQVVLNMVKTDFVDSATLGMLLRALTEARERGGTILIVENQVVDRILTITGLKHVFDVVESEEEAVDQVRSAL